MPRFLVIFLNTDSPEVVVQLSKKEQSYLGTRFCRVSMYSNPRSIFQDLDQTMIAILLR